MFGMFWKHEAHSASNPPARVWLYAPIRPSRRPGFTAAVWSSFFVGLATSTGRPDRGLGDRRHMEIGEWTATRELGEIYRGIRELGLETNLAELEAFGFTVMENALEPDLVDELRGAILRIASERAGRVLDPDHETDHTGMEFQPYLIFRDPAFKRAVVNPGPLALITYLLGKHCVLSSLGCHLKGPGG